jgi:hypothetical protein
MNALAYAICKISVCDQSSRVMYLAHGDDDPCGGIILYDDTLQAH